MKEQYPKHRKNPIGFANELTEYGYEIIFVDDGWKTFVSELNNKLRIKAMSSPFRCVD